MKKFITFFIVALLSAVAAQASPVPEPTPKAASSPQSAKPSTTSKPAIVLPPEKAQPVRVAHFDKAPVIDGKLDDEVWTHAVVLKDFYQTQPGDNIAPSKPTEVYLGYDAKTLYIAFRVHDEPDKVRATIAKRDNIFDDDYVGFFLDTFNDQRKAYEMFFNPFGIQGDAIFTEQQGEDFSVDIVLDSKGVMTEDGWTVEVAIPFKSLRYEAGKDKLWGAHFLRRIKRFNNELDSWMPLSRDISGTLNQAGHLTGLEGISTERTLELIPSLTLSETGRHVASFQNTPGFVDPGRLVNEPVSFDPGLTAKFGLTPTVTLDLALNPDFAQVEADATVVKVNQRFPIFFEEKRPFFLEGKDIFQTPLTIVHTRTIIDPDVAVKLSGKRGRNSFGLMLASDNGPGNFTGDERLEPRNFRFIDKNAYIGVLRLKRDVGKENNLGLIATTYNFIEKHNQLLGFDGRFKLDPQTTLNFQFLGTNSRRFFYNPDLDRSIYRTGNGFAYNVNYDKSQRHFGYNYDGRGFTQDYRADVGFFQRNNTNVHALFVYYNTEPKPKAALISKHFHVNPYIRFDWQGRSQAWGNETQLNLNFKRQTQLGMGFSINYERLFEQEFGPRRGNGHDGAFLGGPERSTYRNNIYGFFGTTPSKKYSVFFFAINNWGAFDFDFGGGPNFPRVSPAAILQQQAIASGVCNVQNPPPVCFDPALDPGPGTQLHFEASLAYQPTDALRTTLDYTKERLTRRDTGRVAFDDNIVTSRTTYQFSRFTFARARIDYDSLSANIRAQFLLGWTPNPGTAFYVGYNDDLNRNGFNPLTGEFEPGFRRNGRTFFIKMSYLFRKSFGG